MADLNDVSDELQVLTVCTYDNCYFSSPLYRVFTTQMQHSGILPVARISLVMISKIAISMRKWDLNSSNKYIAMVVSKNPWIRFNFFFKKSMPQQEELSHLPFLLRNHFQNRCPKHPTPEIWPPCLLLSRPPPRISQNFVPNGVAHSKPYP